MDTFVTKKYICSLCTDPAFVCIDLKVILFLVFVRKQLVQKHALRRPLEAVKLSVAIKIKQISK
jgi:hypothetical protein